jgi:hypothetical protein
MRGRERKPGVDEVLARLKREGRVEEWAAESRRRLHAQSFRDWQEGARSRRKVADEARRSGRSAQEIETTENTARLAEAAMEKDLALYPEFADPELVRWLAPTRWERFVDRVRGR